MGIVVFGKTKGILISLLIFKVFKAANIGFFLGLV